MSPVDYKSQRLNRNEARKLIAEIVKLRPGNIRFSRHAETELANDGLTTTDASNVLRSPAARINREGEWKDGSYRYRVETTNLMVVVAFWPDGQGFNVVTGWDKRRR